MLRGRWRQVGKTVPSFRPACRQPAYGRQGRFQVPSAVGFCSLPGPSPPNPESRILQAASHERRATRQATSDEPRAVCWSFRTPHSAACPPGLSGGFRAPRCFFATSYPQRRLPKSACQKPSNSSQNRSKRRRFPSKRHQKGAHFVMPILTFWGVTPSGASARAVFAFQRRHFGRFGGQKSAIRKLSTIWTWHRGRGSRKAVPGC